MKHEYKTKVTKILNGDTFEIDKEILGKNKIRMSYLSLKDYDHKKVQKRLEDLLLNKNVKINIIAEKDDHLECEVYYGLLFTKNASDNVVRRLKKNRNRI